MHFLGGETVWLEGAPLRLSPRHREILAALMLHPGGLSAAQLALRVWGEGAERIQETHLAEALTYRRSLP